MNEDDNYRREEDRKWRDHVNDRLSNLTASETVQNDRIDNLLAMIDEIGHLLEGVPDDKNDNGIKGDLKELQGTIALIRSVLSLDLTGNPGYDNTGKPGYLKKVELMWRNDERRERRAERWWKGLTPIVVGIIGLLGGALMNLERIVAGAHAIADHYHSSIQSSRETPKNASRKSGRRRRKVVVEPESGEEIGEAE